jgi:hypothetical protein
VRREIPPSFQTFKSYKKVVQNYASVSCGSELSNERTYLAPSMSFSQACVLCNENIDTAPPQISTHLYRSRLRAWHYSVQNITCYYARHALLYVYFEENQNYDNESPR